MAELETFDPGDGGKKGKKSKKGTVNGKKVEVAPDGTKYTVKDGKKIAITTPKTVPTPDAKTKEASRQASENYELIRSGKTPEGKKVDYYKNSKGNEKVRVEGGRMEGTGIGSPTPSQVEEKRKASEPPMTKGGTRLIKGRPEEEYSKDPDRENWASSGVTPSGKKYDLYIDKKTGRRSIKVEGGKMEGMSMSRSGAYEQAQRNANATANGYKK